MQGLMQNWPLTVDRILDHAATWRPQVEIFTATAQGAPLRVTYGQVGARARRLAVGLEGLGVRRGDSVAVLATGTARQLEAWYAIMGMGAVCHPLNPDLPSERLAELMTEAGDVAAFVDPALFAGVEPALRAATGVRQIIALTDQIRGLKTTLTGIVTQDSLDGQTDRRGAWGGADEGAAAALVHTLGATGPAKGVVWSHRACVLQALAAIGPDGLGISSRDAILPLVPFWRAAAWGLVFAAPLAGAKLVLPGVRTDAQSIRVLADREAVNMIVASPADLQALYDQFRAERRRPNRLTRVIAAGGACPPALVKAWKTSFGVEAQSAWGLTETSALGGVTDPETGDMRPPFGLELEIFSPSGAPAPHDGASVGRLRARGATVASGYLGHPAAATGDDFLDTGDLASIDADGRVRIMGRADEIISASEGLVPLRRIEEVALEHPASKEAAALERVTGLAASGPILIVQRKPGMTASRSEYMRFVTGRLGSALAPGEVLFVDAFPRDAVGRVDKRTLRARLDHLHTPPPAPEPVAEMLEPVSIPALVAASAVIYGPAASEAPTPAAPPPPPPVVDAAPEPTPEPAPPPEAAPSVAVETAAIEPHEPVQAEVEPPAAPAPQATPEPEATPPHPERAAVADDVTEEVAESAFAEAVLAAHAPEHHAPAQEADPAIEPPPVVLALDAADPEPLPFARLDQSAYRRTRYTVERSRPDQANAPARVFLMLTAILALAPLLFIASGAIGAHLGLVDWSYGLNDLLFEWPFRVALIGVVGGLLALFVALAVGFGRVWRLALVSLLAPLAILGGLFGVKGVADSFPQVHDVATDWADPIGLSPALIKARGPSANPVDSDPVVPSTAGTYMNRRVAEVNADTCPGAQPVLLAATPVQAYAIAKAALKTGRLALVTDDPRHGRMEASAANLWLGFKDDVAVRVRPDPKGARIDLRSISRKGQGDMGANCFRVMRLVKAMQSSEVN